MAVYFGRDASGTLHSELIFQQTYSIIILQGLLNFKPHAQHSLGAAALALTNLNPIFACDANTNALGARVHVYVTYIDKRL